MLHNFSDSSEKPCRVNPGLMSSWLKTVQKADRRPHGNPWNLVAPVRMMAQNGPIERPVYDPLHTHLLACRTHRVVLTLQAHRSNRTLQ
jgi:hypothetical protein